MMSLSFLPCGIMVSGSSGFIGSSLCDAYASEEGVDSGSPGRMIPGAVAAGTIAIARRPVYNLLHADVSRLDELQHLAQQWRPHTVVHLAAKGSVITQRSQ